LASQLLWGHRIIFDARIRFQDSPFKKDNDAFLLLFDSLENTVKEVGCRVAESFPRLGRKIPVPPPGENLPRIPFASASIPGDCCLNIR